VAADFRYSPGFNTIASALEALNAQSGAIEWALAAAGEWSRPIASAVAALNTPSDTIKSALAAVNASSGSGTIEWALAALNASSGMIGSVLDALNAPSDELPFPEVSAAEQPNTAGPLPIRKAQGVNPAIVVILLSGLVLALTLHLGAIGFLAYRSEAMARAIQTVVEEATAIIALAALLKQ